MPLPRVGSLRLRRDATGAVHVSATPDRSPLVVRAGTALTQLTTAAAAAAERHVLDLGLSWPLA
jgi:hypothetical protein